MKFLIWLSSDCNSLDEVVSSLQKIGHEVGILLVQDGVFLADKGCMHYDEIASLKDVAIYASKGHVEERGIADRILPAAKLVDYPDMVDLMMETYDKIIPV